jgi:hypothetical protein
VLDYAVAGEDPSCVLDNGESGPAINFGTLQPHVPHSLPMWVVLVDALTPTDPHPSTHTLADQNWIMGLPDASVDGASVSWAGEPSNVIPVVR